MTAFKCKMCGGTIEFNPGDSFGTCDSCGTKQTLPHLDSDKKANLFDRANHFRRINEFDKALGIYERILMEDNADAEIYWSIVLCRYGIEYVEDPKSHKRIPTVHRMQFTSILADEDYKSTLAHADEYQKEIYEQEAKTIDEIQKGILALAQKENPVDVFICYKETDSEGKRTPDSVLAQELYHELTEEGFSVFFSRISLEDKLGSAYESCIFSALNSAKVMVVLGTKPEYFNAVWVQNEWSRYLSLIKQNPSKVLIPAYRDMDPYDLPEAFSHLQAQDMSKLGFMQDLIRGIKKITKSEAPAKKVKETVIINSNTTVNIESLLKRVFLFLESKDWKSAKEYCERILDEDPENAAAYLGKLMAEYHVSEKEELIHCAKTFTKSDNYQKILRFGDEELICELKKYNEAIKDRNESNAYQNACETMNNASTEEEYKAASEQFEAIAHIKDSAALAQRCLDLAEEARKNAIYNQAEAFMLKNSIKSCNKAIDAFETILNWKDSEEMIEDCRKKIKKIYLMRALILTAIFCIILAQSLSGRATANLDIVGKYSAALKAINNEDYFSAYSYLNEIKDYKDSTTIIQELCAEHPLPIFRNVVKGDTIYFGSYEQDNIAYGGMEPIEWIVLKNDEKKLIVISKYTLDVRPFNSAENSNMWETSTLRAWLNDDFLNTAFDSSEQKLIYTVITSKAMDESDLGVADQVFLATEYYVKNYADLLFDSSISYPATDYAKARAKLEEEKENAVYPLTWWIFSNDYSGCCKASSFSGSIREEDADDYYGIRPVIWIDIR